MEEFPAVTIFGPRQCGKTTLALTMYPGFSHANLEDLQTRKLAEEDPYEFFIRYPEPVLIDEIQRVPSLLSLVQVRIDEHKKMGQYIITGSQQNRLQNTVSQSLAGRTAIVNLLPLSLNELADAGIVLDRDQQLVSGFMPYLFQTSAEPHRITIEVILPPMWKKMSHPLELCMISHVFIISSHCSREDADSWSTIQP